MQQYIGFNVGTGEYMIPILTVREIIGMPSVTALPELPPYVKGISNLRGSIIPIVNLKNLLNAAFDENTGNTVIVLASGKIIFGIIVDGITGVINADESQIEPPEKFFNTNVENIEGVAKIDNKLIVLLDIRKLLPLDDMSLLEDAIIDVKETGNENIVEVIKEVDTIAGKVTVKELHDAKEFFGDKFEKNDPKHNVFDTMLTFMDALANQEYQKVEGIVEQLVNETDNELFMEVGKITRKLHNSLQDFKGAVDHGLQKLTRDDVPNAVDKLEFVISKTEDAANKTMGIVETYLENSDELSGHIKNIKGHDEDVRYLNAFKDSLEADLTTILTAQQFQDITGQTIKKVIDLVNSVEAELLRLITQFGVSIKGDTEQAAALTGGDEANAAGGEEESVEKVTQSDVEALLNDFGF
ncbi:MAG TPA: hypothetical protein ENG83_13620 [Nitrospirae bacterium]|nr:chemotaxis protein CheW [bacterium BMS3Abin06]HDH13213.1 hypothetical protein [Nitrospirota bacterium]HDL20420.1 hypothetical protein [Nitrospirota bacterium]HDZ01819.1 hypothetical protein [Nitrospirota bacterium]